MRGRESEECVQEGNGQMDGKTDRQAQQHARTVAPEKKYQFARSSAVNLIHRPKCCFWG